ncbi:hypothetical protein [Nitrococcus mobilis]|uniref:Uncharacterized protein n=1 Tax=Nitrococcus mobilis Nb-231 TaxID=314278 RepID=A4BRE9_9GAMM|nr:hypothetical protein [Nitrococcus mobilis]EAR21771.1 hypothetical protein NB231_03540 [Nitrococcus mobilis Nb-231]
MKRTYPHLALNFLVATTALVIAATGSGSERLTNRQLDTVSAGDIGVTATAVAVASGIPTYTLTQTIASVTRSPYGTVEMGHAWGTAYACCGPYTDTEVSTDAYADGAFVLGTSVNTKTSNQYSSTSVGSEFIYSYNPSGLDAPTP